jgi:diguanylate cyclase (GGDEF)-like protein
LLGYVRRVQILTFPFAAADSSRRAHFLGLRDEGTLFDLHVRQARIALMRRAALPRLLFSAFAIWAVSLLLPADLLNGPFGSWAIAASAVALVSNIPHLRPASIALHPHPLGEAALALGAGLLWAAAAFGFGMTVPASGMIGLALVLILWMAAMGSQLIAAPLSMLALMLPAGSGLVCALGMSGLWLTAALAGGAILTLCASAFSHARQQYAHLLDQAALQTTQDMLGLVLREGEDGVGNWMWEIDAARSLKNVSPRLAEALDRPIDALEGCALLPVLAGSAWDSGQVADAIQDLAERLRKRERFSGLLLPFERAGETRWWELSALPCYDAMGSFTGFRGIGCDVTEAHRAVDRINRLAKFDALTGLPNRVHLLEILDQSIVDASRRRSRSALLLIDLDRFKSVNDTFGHPIGDQLLTHVAARLRTLVGHGEVFCRLGGDEFAAVIPDARDPAKVAALAQRIVESLSAPYEINRHQLLIGASVGAAFSPRDGRTADMLLRSADLALYQSKEQGGGSYHSYEPRFLAEAEERRLIEIAFQNALGTGEFSVVYHPIFDASRDALIALEADLRWTSASLGDVAPARFMPVAQDTRLIVPLGDWLLRTACLEAASWETATAVTIRVTTEQLIDSGLARTIRQALALSGLPAQRLTIDVTEECLLRSGDQGLIALDQIGALGVHLSLSDFGPGGAALGHFARTRFGTVRLHPALMRDASDESRESIAMLRAVLTLADHLGIAVVAKGIDNERQFMAARTLGFRQMQGSWFGAPIASEQLHTGWERRAADKAVA